MANDRGPVRTRFRIDLAHPLVCRRKRQNGAGETEAPCHSRCDTIKIPPCSKALRSFLVFSLFCVSSKLWNLSASQGAKTSKLLKTKLSFHVLRTWNNTNLIYFIYQQRKYSRKSINKIIKIIYENITRPLHSQYNFKNENSMKRCIL
jgi:hypothetical protein